MLRVLFLPKQMIIISTIITIITENGVVMSIISNTSPKADTVTTVTFKK
jgi:hypothetical protein